MRKSMTPLLTLVIFTVPALAQVQSWRLDSPGLIDVAGTRPNLWAGKVAYTAGVGGPVRFFDGTTSIQLYDAPLNFEPVNGGASAAWRHYFQSNGRNEVFRWNGSTVVQLTDTPTTIESDLTSGSNGDLMWSENHEQLMYYHASTGSVTAVGVAGVFPSLYIASGGVATYAYQDPFAHNVYYFDGTTLHDLGPGLAHEGPGGDHRARANVWDGRVTWVGVGEGSGIDVKAEIFFWKDGVAQRITNDDAAGGVQDDFPNVWQDLVVWQRGSFSTTYLYVWDGQDTVQLTSTRSMYPSFRGQQVAWVDYATGLVLADLLAPTGDCNANGIVDWPDFEALTLCFLGPGGGSDDCPCGDPDGDGDTDLADLALFQRLYGA